MRVSINLTSYPQHTDLAAYLAELGAGADRAGVDTVWVADHLLQVQPGHAPEEPVLEVFGALTWLAGCTTTVRLGAMVSPVTVRAPALLLKSATTLDVLSGGRAWLGVGAGYQREEARAMGLDLPESVATRFERLEETLAIATRMRAGDADPYAGEHHRLDRPLNRPAPVGRLPIMVGGSGERRTLRLVAQHAQGCNVFDLGDAGATVRRKLAVLDRHCADLGRDPREIERSVSTFWAEDTSVDDLAGQLAELAGHGADHAVLLRSSPWRGAEVDALADLSAELSAV